MKVITFESKAYQDLSRRIRRIESFIEGLVDQKVVNDEFLSSSDVCTYLKISRRTLARITGSGELSFTKVGRKLLFKLSDIEDYLESKYVKR